MAHSHDVIDDDLYFTIDPSTREINNESQKVKLMQYDHNSEQFTFELPRFVEGHDMSLCNSIRVNYINIHRLTREQNPGVYEVSDIQVREDNIIFSWLVSRNATQYAGPLNFLIKFMCFDEDGNVIYEWHTDIFKNVSVSTGINNEETIEEVYPDILEKWKNDVLSNLPPQTVLRVDSLDTDNMVVLRDLDSGSYILYGRFKPYSGSASTMTFGSKLLVNVLKSTDSSQIQIFYPYNNCVQYLKITDTAYERTNVYLNDLATKDYVGQIDTNGIVRYDRIQELSENEKKQARENIGFDSILPAYSSDNYKGTFVVNATGGLEVQPYDWNYLSNKPFGKLDGYEPIAKLSVNTTEHTFTFTSGDKYLFKSSNKYWVVDYWRQTGWLATASVMSSYDIYMLFVDTEKYPQATISEFDLAAGAYKEYIETTGGIIGVPTSIVIYNENEWGTKMMDETYIPSSIQRVGGDIIIPSSTADSTKKFKITVDDSGTISATEVTE